MKRRIIFACVVLAAVIRQLLLKNDFAFKLLFAPGMGGLRTRLGKWKAWYCFEKARRDCPAYKQFLEEHPGEVVLNGWTPDLSQIAPMDKANFVKRYSMADRCHGGKIPTRGAVIDTSSGSTGKPTSWVRGKAEREAVARVMQIALRQLVPNKQILFINAFALGPWATGMCVSHAISDECLLVSVGPDVDKIVDVMRDFGPDQFMYVVAGYPPFLKMLVDNKGIEWKNYDAIAFYGGEGMSESMREYLMQAFRTVHGDYGASDLEINIGAENDFTVALRRLMESNESLRHRLNGLQTRFAGCEHLQDALPHIFQYNSLDYLIEVGDAGELLVTLCRTTNAAPKIRYNIHDSGFVMSYKDLKRVLKAEGIKLKSLPPVIANLPLMFHYGRSDDAVSYYGSKIPPAAISKIIFGMPELATKFNSFRLITREDEQHNKHLKLAIELVKGAELPADAQPFCDAIFAGLAKDSQDYRESSRIALEGGITPTVEFHGFGEGPFQGSDIRMKCRYKDETEHKEPAPDSTQTPQAN